MPAPPRRGPSPSGAAFNDIRGTIPLVPGAAVDFGGTEEVTAFRAPSPRASAPPPPPVAEPAPIELDLPKFCSSCGRRFAAELFLCPFDSLPLLADRPLPEAVDPLIGQVLNQTFRVVRLIGEGGMGKVYEARHLRLGEQRFAVKVLLPEFAQNAEIVARFQREAESASSISHPNVVQVIDVHRTREGAPYLVAEFLDGEELGAFVEKVGRLGVPFAVGIARQVCRGLAAAHAKGVVHRDMKPENVFLLRQQAGEQGVPRVKVIDFGVSRVKDHDINLTQAGVILGTPSFMSPEQARAEVVDERADIYAVGAVLYNLLTGLRPFDADDPTRTLIMLLTEELPPVRHANPMVPPGLDEVIRVCLAKNREERFRSMAELDAALAPFDSLDGQRASAPPPLALPARALGAPATGGGGTSFELAAQALGGGAPAPRALRPTVIGYGAAMLVLGYGTLALLLLGVARVVFGEGAFDGVGSLLFLHIFALGLTIVAGAIVGQSVRERAWDNERRLSDLAQDLRAAVVVSLLGLVLALGLARWLAIAVLNDAPIAFSGAWDILAALGCAFGAFGFVARRLAASAAADTKATIAGPPRPFL
ncbi:MAG: serine/threonine protein kinase [Myxococcales bacterium]|nr:serine/threonine protein kinase [Myxococcales bacterium]